MQVGDLIKIRTVLFGRHEPLIGILVEISPDSCLVERDGSPGAWYHVHTMGRTDAHRKHNLEVVNASR